MPHLNRQYSRIAGPLQNVFRRLVQGELPWPLYLWGPTGTGKTRAALWLCDVVASSVYATADRATDWLVRSEFAWWESVAHAELATLDELGCRSAAADVHYQAVKRFCDLREDRPACYASNLRPGELPSHYDDRIASRVLSGTVFELGGVDRRFSG